MDKERDLPPYVLSCLMVPKKPIFLYLKFLPLINTREESYLKPIQTLQTFRDRWDLGWIKREYFAILAATSNVL